MLISLENYISIALLTIIYCASVHFSLCFIKVNNNVELYLISVVVWLFAISSSILLVTSCIMLPSYLIGLQHSKFYIKNKNAIIQCAKTIKTNWEKSKCQN